MNAQLARVITSYNKKLPNQANFAEVSIEKLRNYFLIKASVSESLHDAAHSLNGLEIAT